MSEHTFNSHITDVHPESLSHDFELIDHPDGSLSNHSASAVDIDTDQLLKKTTLQDSLVFILFFLAIFLVLSRLWCMARQTIRSIPFTSCNYLLHPPLRAPPIK